MHRGNRRDPCRYTARGLPAGPWRHTGAPQKTELTLACFWLNYDLRSQIVLFNKTNADYRIVVKDYAEYSSDGDPSAGLTKLNTEIISGNAPDLIANDMLASGGDAAV